MGLRGFMLIYLPIAEVSVNAFLLLGLGGLVGVLSGMFGVGGGFLMTPLLFFIGIPPAVAVATEANQIVASSFSGVLAHLRRKTVDLRMGTVLLIGAGKMGMAMASGWVRGGLPGPALTLVDPQPHESVSAFADQHGATLRADLPDATPRVVVLAVKPQIMDGVLGMAKLHG